MHKIMIIGKSGSGKTKFASILGQTLHREVTHLDRLFWKDGWMKAYSEDEWVKKMKELVARDTWIIDGDYMRTLDIRLEASDFIIFFNLPMLFCLFNIMRRLYHSNRKVLDKVDGVKERISWELIRRILMYPTKEVMQKLQDQRSKQIYVIKRVQDIDEVLCELTTALPNFP